MERPLDDFEYAIMEEIYRFSSEKGFRLGVNERDICTNIGYRPECGFELSLGYLLEQGLVYIKESHNFYNRYWLPTKLGRQYIESKRVQ